MPLLSTRAAASARGIGLLRAVSGGGAPSPAPFPVGPFTMNYLVVAGGGGSGGNGGGGGGAGGLLQGSFSTTSGTGPGAGGYEFTVTVGSGGGGFSPGSNSVLSNSAASVSITATGGGRGANRDGPGGEAGTGGSGGGGSAAYGSGSQEYGVAGTPGQGYPGGNGTRGNVPAGGGGGGAGGAGVNNNGSTQGGAGGNGVLSTITGYPTGYAGGGGGSGIDYGGWNGYSGTVHYSGGIWYGGGGWQTQFSLGQRDGRRNSGGGGGGLGDGNPNAAGQSDSGGGSGGSGVVVVSYAGEQRAYGGNTYSIAGNTVHIFHQTGILYTFNPTTPLVPETSGLIVHLDAADPRSFPGPGTTALGTSVGVGNNTTWYNLMPGGANATISYNFSGWPPFWSGALYFDGSTQYVTMGSLATSFTNFTVEVWFKSDSVSNYRNVLDCNYSAGGSNIGPRLEQNSSGGLSWAWGSSGGFNSISLASSGIGTSVPYQAVITRSGSTAIGYLNGSQIGSSVTETYSHPGTFGAVNFAQGFSSSAERWYQGYLSIVRLYNVALTGTQVARNFNSQRSRFGI